MPSTIVPGEQQPFVGVSSPARYPGMVYVDGNLQQQLKKSNLAANTNPGVDDDVTLGYSVGSTWINTTAGTVWFCVDATDGAASWKDTSSSGIPAGTGTELQYRVNATTFGAVAGSSWSGTMLTLPCSTTVASASSLDSALLTLGAGVRASYLGHERSTGGELFMGTSAFATVLGSASGDPVQLVTGGVVRVTVDGTGGFLLGGSAGIDVNPGSDTDVDLLTVGVTGTPTLRWDESEDAYDLSKGIKVNGTLAATTVTGANVTSGADPGHTHSAYSPTGHNHDAAYISLVTTPTAGNFATLTDGGELVNSAYGPSSFSASGHEHSGTYEPVIAAGTTGQYWRGDKSWQTLDKTAVGLGNVENTALSTWAGTTNVTTLGTITTGTWNAGSVTSSGVVSLAAGSASAPALAFTGDTHTGLYSPGNDQVAIATLGTQRLYVGQPGGVGIGLQNAGTDYQLMVGRATGGTLAITTNSAPGSNAAPLTATLFFLGYGNYPFGSILAEDRSLNTTGGWLKFRTMDTYGALQDRMTIDSAGNVGIGTTTPDKKLEVNSATGDCLRLTYNDSNGSAAYYADFTVSSGGNLTIASSGTLLTLSGIVLSPFGSGSNSHKLCGAGNAGATGAYNLAVGPFAGYYWSTGGHNVAVGGAALYNNSTGSGNVAIGYYCLNAVTGDKNIGIGLYAGRYETGSNAFYVNNVDESSSANEKAYSLLYGTFSGSASSLTGQTLTVNAATFTANAKAQVNRLRLLNKTELTIASGAVTATRGFHTIDTESDAASDDLDTVNGGEDGDVLVIRANHTDRTVVAKDGTGNLALNGDCTLDASSDTLTLIYDGDLSKWVELARSGND